MQAGNINTSVKVILYFNLPALRAMNILTCKCNVDYSYEGGYYLILGQDLLLVSMEHNNR